VIFNRRLKPTAKDAVKIGPLPENRANSPKSTAFSGLAPSLFELRAHKESPGGVFLVRTDTGLKPGEIQYP
jgi:hypothetical protein